ncbi:hypothetical protein DFH09DRAFT_1359801 [Mycena vulgaris]|nr:hypothetical protein DFH09DRAFT_1359801 [Mycena vulgaris]
MPRPSSMSPHAPPLLTVSRRYLTSLLRVDDGLDDTMLEIWIEETSRRGARCDASAGGRSRFVISPGARGARFSDVKPSPTHDGADLDDNTTFCERDRRCFVLSATLPAYAGARRLRWTREALDRSRRTTTSAMRRRRLRRMSRPRLRDLLDADGPDDGRDLLASERSTLRHGGLWIAARRAIVLRIAPPAALDASARRNETRGEVRGTSTIAPSPSPHVHAASWRGRARRAAPSPQRRLLPAAPPSALPGHSGRELCMVRGPFVARWRPRCATERRAEEARRVAMVRDRLRLLSAARRFAARARPCMGALASRSCGARMIPHARAELGMRGGAHADP